MKIITYLSNFMIPFLIAGIVGYGLLNRRNIYEDFLEGAKDGLKTVGGICTSLIGLMTAVGVLRASGFLDFLVKILEKAAALVNFPSELVPLSVIRLFSSSAATGLLLDIFKNYGPDSEKGLMAALILSSTESVFYCISVYYGSVGIRRTRYTLAGALTATFAGICAAVWIAGAL